MEYFTIIRVCACVCVYVIRLCGSIVSFRDGDNFFEFVYTGFHSNVLELLK